MNLKPLSDRVVIRRMPDLEESGGGVLIPETAREHGQLFEVAAVGPGRIFAIGMTRSQIAAAVSFLSIDDMSRAVDELGNCGIAFGQRVPVGVVVGDVVLMGRYSGSDVRIDGVDYVIVRDEEIMAVVPRKKEPVASSQ